MLGLPGEEPGEVGLLIADGPEQFVLVTAVEGRLTDQHLVQEDAKGPPVHTVGVLQTFNDLGLKQKITFTHIFICEAS